MLRWCATTSSLVPILPQAAYFFIKKKALYSNAMARCHKPGRDKNQVIDIDIINIFILTGELCNAAQVNYPYSY